MFDHYRLDKISGFVVSSWSKWFWQLLRDIYDYPSSSKGESNNSCVLVLGGEFLGLHKTQYTWMLPVSSFFAWRLHYPQDCPPSMIFTSILSPPNSSFPSQHLICHTGPIFYWLTWIDKVYERLKVKKK